ARPDRLAARAHVSGRLRRNRTLGVESANGIFTSRGRKAGNRLFTGWGPGAIKDPPGAANRDSRRPMTNPFEQRPITRRKLMRYGGAAAAGLAGASPLMRAASALARPVRTPDSLPNPKAAAGTVNEALPFDHIVVVMMENHSFDNLLGALHRS